MDAVPISTSALDDARRFFEDRGVHGFEGTGMLAGRRGAGITRFVHPDQIARRSKFGVSVEVTQKGKLELASSLQGDELWLARIHSHPGDAFHSLVDDENPGLTAEGSFSIVVPYFGLGLRRGLEACAVFRLEKRRWAEIPEERIGAFLRAT